jgi:hypothetical protein
MPLMVILTPADPSDSAAASTKPSSIAVHKELAAWQAGLPAERRIVFRIGVKLGDVVVEGEDLLGDGAPARSGRRR